MLASEALFTLESIVKSVQKFFNNYEKILKGARKDIIQRLLPTLRSRLGTSAHRLLRHNWEDENLEGGWKRSVRPFKFCILALILRLMYVL